MDILLYAHPEVVERKIEMRGEILEAYTEIAYRIEPQEKWDRFAAEWHAVGRSPSIFTTMQGTYIGCILCI